MRRPFTALVFVTSAFAAATPLGAQPPAGAGAAVVDSTTQLIERYVRAHLVLAGMRDKEQAELAEPRSKKGEVQTEIRTRYIGLRAAALKGAGYTEAQFTADPTRISTDDALRVKFEAALARASAR